MKNQLIACCGLDCENCDARKATIHNDDALREKTAKEWCVMNNTSEITPETINCTGCRTEGAKFAYCTFCEIRKCVQDKGFDTCADCELLDTCKVVAPVLENAPAAKENLLSNH